MQVPIKDQPTTNKPDPKSWKNWVVPPKKWTGCQQCKHLDSWRIQIGYQKLALPLEAQLFILGAQPSWRGTIRGDIPERPGRWGIPNSPSVKQLVGDICFSSPPLPGTTWVSDAKLVMVSHGVYQTAMVFSKICIPDPFPYQDEPRQPRQPRCTAAEQFRHRLCHAIGRDSSGFANPKNLWSAFGCFWGIFDPQVHSNAPKISVQCFKKICRVLDDVSDSLMFPSVGQTSHSQTRDMGEDGGLGLDSLRLFGWVGLHQWWLWMGWQETHEKNLSRCVMLGN